MSAKPRFLSLKDSERVSRVSEAPGQWREAVSLLRQIEKNYNIDDVRFKDDQSLRYISRYPATIAHLTLLVYLHLYGYDVGQEFTRTVCQYADKSLKEIEKKVKSQRKSAFYNLELLSFQIIHLSALLGEIYSSENDFRNLLRTYAKFVKYIPNCSKGEVAEICSQYWRRLTRNGIPLNAPISPNVFTSTVYGRLMKTLHDRQIRMYGSNPGLMNSFIDALNFADDNEACLILGETGTGKELIASTIHEFSKRRENNFWKVNCAGFTESLFDSEICGIVVGTATEVGSRLGAFLKACGREKGGLTTCGYYVSHGNRKFRDSIRFKINNKDIRRDPTPEELKEFGGTLFLDEVNSMPVALQTKLLRIIEDKKSQVVGEDRTRSFDAKIVSATNEDLSGDYKETHFREDLYYRLGRGIIRLPALREMRESIPEIAECELEDILERLNAEEYLRRAGAKKKVGLQKRTADKLVKYDWPGNIRELQNVLYRAVKNMILDGADLLKHDHIEDLTGRKNIPKQRITRARSDDELAAALRKHGGNRTAAAKELSLSYRHLLRRINEMGGRGIQVPPSHRKT